MKNKRLFQILLPVLILAVIAGIWLIKSKGEESDNPLEISTVNMTEIKAAQLPVVIDFGSDTCIPCIEMAPVLEKMHTETQGKAIIHFVNVGKYAEAAKDFPIRVIPTQIFYTADGKPFVPSDEMQSSLPFTLYESSTTKEHLFTVHEGGLTESQMRSILADMGVE